MQPRCARAVPGQATVSDVAALRDALRQAHAELGGKDEAIAQMKPRGSGSMR